MSELTKEQVKESMKEIVTIVGEEDKLWNGRDLKEFFIEDQSGAFMLIGFFFGRGHTAAQINATLPAADSLEAIIEDIDFS